MAAEPVHADRPPQRRQLHAVPDPTDEVMPPWPPIPDDLDATAEMPTAGGEQVTPAQAGLIVRMLAAARSDLSAWWLVAVRPKYLADPNSGYGPLLQYGGTILQDRIIFGSSFPMLPVARSVAEIKALPLSAEVQHKWLHANAAAFLGRG